MSVNSKVFLMMFFSFAFLMLSGCKENGSDSQVKRIKLHAKSGVVSVHWDANNEGVPAIDFAIPQERLDHDLAMGVSSDHPSLIYVWVPISAELGARLTEAFKDETQHKAKEYAITKEKLVQISEGSENQERRKNRHKRWAMTCDVCVRDGTEGGLDRFSRLYCGQNDQKNTASGRGFATSTDVDYSTAVPDGCVMERGQSFLTNSMEKDAGDRAVEVGCWVAGCHLEMQYRGRNVYVFLYRRQVSLALNVADEIRSGLDTYVIK